MKKASVHKVCERTKKKPGELGCPFRAPHGLPFRTSTRSPGNEQPGNAQDRRVACSWDILQILKNMAGLRRHWYFEWPTRCQGWQLPELVAFRSHCIAKGWPVYKVRIDGCMYGLMSKDRPGTYLKKAWTIWTTDPTFGPACGRCCRGSPHPHTVIMVRDTNRSGFYPKAMGEAIARHWDPRTHSQVC